MKLKIIYFILIFFYLFTSSVTGETITKSAQLVAQWPFHPTKAIAVDTARDLVFMGDGEQISVLDSDLDLITLFSVTESGQIGSIFYARDDNFLYAACKNDGLRMIDLSDPENPAIAGSYFYPDNDSIEINGVYVENQIAYLACGLGGVLVLDITNPDEPVLLSEVALPGAWGYTYAMDIFVSGDYAWVADLINGVHVIDVSEPDQAKGIKLIGLAGARDLMISGTYLYTALEGSGIEIIDISDPQNPTEASAYANDGGEIAIRANDDFAYIGYASKGIRGLDITDKTAPVDNPAWVYSDTGATGISFGTDENTLFITSEQTGMHKIDITDKSNMNQIASYDTPADAVAIDISGNYLYAVDNQVGSTPESEGLRILHMSVSSQSIQYSLTGFCKTPGTANDVTVKDDFAFIADGDQGLQIISLSDKSTPEITGSSAIPGNSIRVDVADNYAYVAGVDQGLSIINISDKSSPFLIASVGIQGEINDVKISGNYAYIANGSNGMMIIDITDKLNPNILSSIDTPGIAEGLSVILNYAYIADGNQGIAVIDISNELNPKLASSLNTPGYASKISVSGDYAFIADGEKGLFTANISNPVLPIKETNWSYDTIGITSDVFSGFSTDNEDIFIFLADGPSGVVAVNLAIEDDSANEGQSTGSSGGGCFIQAIR